MARLSGMPSEHHHEGPGDAPRRKRGRPSKNQTSSQLDVASTGKRTASPTAELSQTKRTKRTQVDDEDQIAEEMEQSFSRSQHGDTIHVETHSSTTTRRPSRRHSEPPVAGEDASDDASDVDELASTQPLSSRLGAVRHDLATTRRARMSMPAQLHVERVDEEIDGTQFQYAPLTAVLDGRTRRRLRRSHLSQEVNEIEGHHKKDKTMLLELRRQLKAQDAKIKELEFNLEAHRLGDITLTNDHAEQLVQQLEEAREEIDTLRASDLYNGSEREPSTFDGAADLSDDEDSQMLLVNPDELTLSRDLDFIPAPDGKYASRVKELSSQMTFESMPEISQLTHDTLLEDDDTVVADKIEDQAVERYERELQHYIRILAESQGALRVVTLELQNLHYMPPGNSTTDILTGLRHGFNTLRLEIEKLFPNSTANLTNQELLQKVPELFGGIFFELRQKLTVISASQKTELLLRRQYEGVLDLLGESEERIRELENKEFALDKSNEEKQRTINNLEERVVTLTDLANGQEVELTTKTVQINGLQNQVEDKDTDLARLRAALEKLHKDLDTVTQTATAFETQHHETITRMEQEHWEVVQSLQAELANEQEGREAAEGDAQQKGEIIDDLEGRIERMESEVDVITDEMVQLRARLADQTEARETAEGDRDQQIQLVYQHTNTMENLNDTIVDLQAQLKQYRANLATERTQREQTETALDLANVKIDDLENRLHNTGLQANELRSKLFQLQQEKENAIAQLQQAAEEAQEAFDEQLAAEAHLRETAEKTVAKLDKQIAKLQGELATLEIDLTNMTEARQLLEQDREEQTAALREQLLELQAKYTALESSTSSTITSLQANIKDLNNQVHQQQAEIIRLTEEGLEKDRTYAQDTTELNQEIAELKGDLAEERVANEGNRKEIASLSKRVEHEANELLNIVNAHGEQINSLKIVISTQEATIKTLQDQAAQRSTEYEELLFERTTEIEQLRSQAGAQLETIVILEANVASLKEKFAEQEEDNRKTLDSLNAAHHRLLEENEQLSTAAKKRSADTLKAVQQMKTERIVVKTQGVDLNRVQNGKVTKITEKVKVGKKGQKGLKKVATRGWRDSGYGPDDEGSAEAGPEINDEEFLAA
jgi:DNA repair exonuclease SbcCD ATPase subunit